MSMPTNPSATTLAQINNAVEANRKAGDWVYSGMPYVPGPLPDDPKDLTPEDIVVLTGKKKVSKKG